MIEDYNKWMHVLAENSDMHAIYHIINDSLTYEEKINMTQAQFDERVALEEKKQSEMLARQARLAEQQRLRDNKRVRFEQASRLLTGKYAVRVNVVDSPMYPPACYDLKKHILTLNQNFPLTKDDAERLIYDRALIYHECGHVRWTRDHANIREKLSKASPNPRLFLDISNILEDGRIEWLMAKTWHGSKAYLDTLIAACFEQNKDSDSPLSGLVFYVRYGKMITEGQDKYWLPVMALINKGIRCVTTKQTMEIADEIVRIMHKEGMNPEPVPTNPGQKPPENDDDDGDEEGEGEGNPGEGSPENEQGEPGESGEGQESAGEGQNDSEGNLEASEGQSGGNPFDDKAGGSGAGAEKTLEEQVQEIAQAALDELREGAEAEIEELKQPAPIEEMPAKPQMYDGDHEESEAGQVALVLRSIKVERSRRIWQPAARSGKIDTRRIVGIKTGDSFLVRRDEAKGDISVALLVDGSGSMAGNRQRIAGQCARIINGALQQVGMPSVVVYFGDEVKVKSRAEMNNPCHGGTDTAGAMIAARDWLTKQKKSNGRGLMLIVTDGCPNSPELCIEVFNAICEEGAVHVICFMIGGHAYSGSSQELWSHKQISVEQVSNLSGQLEQVLIEAAGML